MPKKNKLIIVCAKCHLIECCCEEDRLQVLKDDAEALKRGYAPVNENGDVRWKKTTASVLSDEELIAEFNKRFIVPQYYTRDQIEDKISDAGKEPTEEQIDEFIEVYKSEGYYDVDESLRFFIEERIE